jgi:thiol-disulfide isomerase/thioredoxin
MKTVSKIFCIYLLIIIFILITNTSFSQVVATHFNASWNEPNKAEWIGDLEECEITYVDISNSPKIQKKHKVTVVPTIIIFKDGEEMKRWEADLSFKMSATIEELQEYINELIKDVY